MNTQSTDSLEGSREALEETRRCQLIEVTIDSLAELGYPGTTLAQIAGRAGVSPGLVAHYFGDKDGLLDAAFRSLTRRVGDHVRARLRQISTPRTRIQAVIDANLAPEEFEQRTGSAWLAFWGQVLQVKSLRRVQSVYQRRTLTNLRSALKKLLPPDEAQNLAAMIAAMIDGVWLRAALSGWREADSESARALLTEFVDGRLRAALQTANPQPTWADANLAEGSRLQAKPPAPGERFASLNPATGEVLGYVVAAGAAKVDAAVLAAQRAQRTWAAMTGAERARVLRRAAELLRARAIRNWPQLETHDTGKPIQETQVVDVVSGAECFEYFAALAQSLSGEHIDLGIPGLRLHAPRAARRRGGNRRVELSAANRLLEVGAGARVRQCDDLQAGGTHAAFRREAAGDLLEAGLPAGLFQVVQGFADTGRLLTRHPAIRKVSLTGEVGTGKAVMAMPRKRSRT